MFLAFTTPIPLSNFSPRTAATSPRRRPVPTACASSPSDDPAIMAGQDIRDNLRKLSEERQAQAERTQNALEDMSAQISKIMAELRAESGMPPVADISSPSTSSSSSSSSFSSSSSTVADDAASSSSASAAAAAAAASDDSSEPYMDPQNFGYESTAGWQVLAESAQLPETEGRIEFRIDCDDAGCSLVELKADDTPAGSAGVRSRFVQRGQGWRLGFDPDAARSACALIGTDAWLVSLSYEEIRHVKLLSAALQRKMDRIGFGDEEVQPGTTPVVRRSSDGIYNMRIAKVGLDSSVELESRLLWLQAIGQPVRGQYGVKAIFFDQRQVEVFWSPDAVAGLFAAVGKLGVE